MACRTSRLSRPFAAPEQVIFACTPHQLRQALSAAVTRPAVAHRSLGTGRAGGQQRIVNRAWGWIKFMSWCTCCVLPKLPAAVTCPQMLLSTHRVLLSTRTSSPWPC